MTDLQLSDVQEPEHAEDTDTYCLSDAEADRLLDGAPWTRFAVLGDSLAEGLGEPTPGYRTLTWADRTRDALARQQPQLAYRNLGLRNLVSAEVREQQLGAALDFAPDVVALVCGGNDVFSRSYDPDRVEAEIDGIVAPLRDSGAEVVTYCLMNITKAIPELAGLEAQFATLNAAVRSVADRRGALLVDMWPHPTCRDRDMFSSDMLHSSMRGHAVLGAETIKRLARRLAA
ncbi:Lysophospholipase L1 [Jatrophihabitans endophyticus]|uniref:Lysophospholipase L1 n=1 Tax=Jatrophihabitans endophyticus TaxID=1206085 RepID=A0A1M5REK2_9ACTN|nr:SGNH/GDSL hydrolase family protein [Jatrophihabitans endophyticus]SHH24681.1 Lysophospholipase L1 [Jatrophihabitans endophyticus]